MIGLPLLRGGPFLFQTRSVWASGCNGSSAHRSFVNISGNPFPVLGDGGPNPGEGSKDR
jgi:hypothetical protein